MNFINEDVENFAHDHTEPESDLFRLLQDETHATMPSPNMLVGRIEGQFLKLLVQLTSARRVLEIGTFTGYSALMMAEGLPTDGRLVTCEINPKAAEIARRYFAKSPHGHKIELRSGAALETIATLTAPFDLIFIDADKTNYLNYYEACLPCISGQNIFSISRARLDGCDSRVQDMMSNVKDLDRHAAGDLDLDHYLEMIG